LEECGEGGIQFAQPGVSVRGLTDALEAQLDRAGIDTAHMVGNSSPAVIDQELSQDRSHRAGNEGGPGLRGARPAGWPWTRSAV
jgi:hypothetical protein